MIYFEQFGEGAGGLFTDGDSGGFFTGRDYAAGRFVTVGDFRTRK